MNQVRITIFAPALQTQVSFVRITQWLSRASGQTQRTWEPGYDRADQLSGVSENADTRYTYRYDKSGNRLSEQIAQRIAAAAYNNTNQLTKVIPGGPYRIEGTVDEPADVTVNGVNASVDTQNRFRADVPLEPGQREIEVKATDGSGNTATRRYQLTVEANGQPRTLTYDLDGNLLDDGADKTYTWDALNRLIKITFATLEAGQPNVIEFAYDGYGQRVQETHDGVIVKRWLWAGGYQPAEERDAQNRVTKRYYAGIGEQHVATDNTTTNYYYTTDHLGSVRELIDASGNIRARYDYDPFGRRSKVQGDLDAAFGFTGHLYHNESKLSLTYYRAYDPALGRWLSRDPIAERGGLNLYAYVKNNSLNNYDPDGRNAVVIEVVIGVSLGQILLWGTLGFLAGLAIKKAIDESNKPIAFPVPVAPPVPDVNGGPASEALPEIGPWDESFPDAGLLGGQCFDSRANGQGERGWAGKASGTDNPHKHMRPHPTNPNKVLVRDPQTGKWITKPRPPDFKK